MTYAHPVTPKPAIPLGRWTLRGASAQLALLFALTAAGCSSEAAQGVLTVPDGTGVGDTGPDAGGLVDVGVTDTWTPGDAAMDATDVPTPEDVLDDAGEDTLVDTAIADIAQDAGTDTALPDATDAGPTDDTGGPSCEPPGDLGPLEFMLQVQAAGDATWTLVGTGTVTQAEPYCCDADWNWSLTVTTDQGTVQAVGKLPGGPPLPLVVGEEVTVAAMVNMPWWTEQYLAISTDAGLRMALYTGTAPATGPCANPAVCPPFAQAETACPPVDATCGQAVYPPVEVYLGSPGTLVAPPGKTTSAAGLTVHVAQSRKNVTSQCADYPETWLAVAMLGKPPCDGTKLQLDQTNAAQYEFYELCIPNTDVAAVEAALKGIDASLYCGVAGGFAGCAAATETGCHGDLAFDGAEKRITDAKWAQLCLLSQQPAVSTIGGGHFVD